MRWRLIIEECGPELYYIKGDISISADALSRLEITDSKDISPNDNFKLAENSGWENEDLPNDAYPIK